MVRDVWSLVMASTNGRNVAKNKQPYFIYAPQDENVRVEDAKCWEAAEFDRSRGWKGPKVLKMAGLFDVWTSPLVSSQYFLLSNNLM
ncbi:abasic site processing protein HMCES-like [Nilaparvata lugens]|uniref:abasic site processing protein HMCES-like n=1 Tax=Nilaparvata lugens TaxID=108931 RepID=UPI00193D0FF9|nr:abasic site processing protein HMCES-like [Nilaparvata lugens]